MKCVVGCGEVYRGGVSKEGVAKGGGPSNKYAYVVVLHMRMQAQSKLDTELQDDVA